MLTKREIQVLTGWIRCDSKLAVANSLFISLGTVNTHLTRIRAKYAAVGRPASTKASLVARALQDGLIDIADL
ncbi:MAG: DNA-binding CsgD family transcriptional regulator [Rhodococcus sp. (in: high G+C Gram-positive bacteria)]|jgi:DNA-binding CsgD family transcriptional regulator